MNRINYTQHLDDLEEKVKYDLYYNFLKPINALKSYKHSSLLASLHKLTIVGSSKLILETSLDSKSYNQKCT